MKLVNDVLSLVEFVVVSVISIVITIFVTLLNFIL